ncbi:MAG: S8 family serine peptidase [Microscillaceae bacterium]|nr:S8 family serine peptidase [Microscillaceae bacterium]
MVLISFFNVGFGQNAHSQQKYWLVFKDKNPATQANYVSEQTLLNRQLLHLPLHQTTDIPLNINYLQKIKNLGIAIYNQSKWLNAVSAYLTDNQLIEVKKLDFIQEIIATPTPPPSGGRVFQSLWALPQNSTSSNSNWGEIFSQAGLSGKDVAIGIIDVGFAEADQAEKLSHLFVNQQVIQTKDFVNPKNKKLFKAHTPQDWHGREVWQMIAGIDPQTQQTIGFAPNAKFYLARTDHAIHENRHEEANWIAAIEWLDSLGVRLVNTSLGYAEHFNNPAENYQPQAMNGKTTLISRFAQIASQEKGMILVVSAGNEGDNPNWQVITAPADAPDVIAVGASQSKVRMKMRYSSVGPEFLDYIKPEITCHADMGTSFAAPVITGMLACLLEKKPQLQTAEIRQILLKSGHLYPFANNYLGFGVPRAETALQLLANPQTDLSPNKLIKLKSQELIINELPQDLAWVVVYHKKNQKDVILEQKLKPTLPMRITRPCQAHQTTIDLGKEVWEIVWK